MTSLTSSRVAREHDPFEWIDRRQILAFRFEGRAIQAHAGDSIASALWASGEHIFGQSLKKRRPRGVDAGMLVQDGALGAVPTDDTVVKEGMDLRFLREPFAYSLPGWVAAGTKLGPDRYYDAKNGGDLRHEYAVRQWVGLTELPTTKGVEAAKRHATDDVLVVGGGLSGIAAALAACAQGARVTLVEQSATLGGRAVASADGRARLLPLLRETADCQTLRVRTDTTALGIYDDGFVPLLGPEGITKFRARAVVLATGRVELPAIFRNNDLPGVMTIASAERLLFRYGVRPGARVVVMASSKSATLIASALAAAGSELSAIVETPGSVVEEALAGDDGTLAAVVIRSATGRSRVACDALVVSAGSSPNDALALGARRTREAVFEPVSRLVASGVWATGSLVGCSSADECITDGARVAELATERSSTPPGARESAESVPRLDAGVTPTVTARAALLECAPIVAHSEGCCFVDLDEDVELGDLEVAIAEGFNVSALLSAYTKLGRGFSQSKASHAQAARVLSESNHGLLARAGRPLPRPPVRPVAMRFLAGRPLHPRRRTPMHAFHVGNGAELLIADDWERPAVYRRSNDRQNDVDAEVRAVRTGVGLIDVGTLGKLEIAGPDAARLLDQVYTGRFSDMSPGTCRYALLCDESGTVVDDGVAARLAADRFYVTTTTSASAVVYREMSRWALEFGLEVVLTNLTGAIAAMNLAGPSSRAVLARVADDATVIDCPYLAARETTLAGVPSRLLRVGFVGELGYELHVPANAGLRTWQRLLDAGHDADIRPFGVEAQRALRLEKGHVIVGQDTDALSSPYDVGLGWAVKMQKPSFVSRRSLAIRRARPKERVLVGFAVEGPDGKDVRECHLVVDETGPVGRVTSVVQSPTLGKTIGLAFVPAGAAHPGASFTIRLDRERRIPARVVPTPFYDPEGARQRLTPSTSLVENRRWTATRAHVHGDVAPEASHGRAEILGVHDVSRIGRHVVKGPFARAALASTGTPFPDAFFEAAPCGPWAFVARTGRTEFWLEDVGVKLDGAIAGAHVFDRQDVSLLLTGSRLPELLAEMTATSVDPGTPRLHLTDVLRVSSMILGRPGYAVPAVQVWFDATYRKYVANAVTAMATELGGGWVSSDAVSALGFHFSDQSGGNHGP